MTTAIQHGPLDDVAVPKRPLAQRLRVPLIWAAVAAVLAWSWSPAEIFKFVNLFTDWRNMAEFGSAFLRPDFHEWRLYLEEMVVTIQIAVWGTALAVRARHSVLDPERVQYLPAMDRAAGPPPDGFVPRHQ